MIRAKKILIATDLSESSRSGLTYACAVAAARQAALIIACVANNLAAWQYYWEDIPFSPIAEKSGLATAGLQRPASSSGISWRRMSMP